MLDLGTLRSRFSTLRELAFPELAPAVSLPARIDLSPVAAAQGASPTEQFQTEISAFAKAGTKKFIISSGGGSTLQVTDVSSSSVGAPLRTSLGAYTSQAVATFGTLVAVALSPSAYGTTAGKGLVRFYQIGETGSLTLVKDVEAGFGPDSIAFTPDGSKLVIANEGEPIANYAIDRPGSIGIIDINGVIGSQTFSYTDIGFAGVTLPSGIRISGAAGTTQATDIEPEYVSIQGNFAYVTLQENNGVAKVNLTTKAIERVFALGTVDYNSLVVDLTDRDTDTGSTSLIKPLLAQAYEGLRMADGIAAFNTGGTDYFITANEGDGREYGTYTDEARGSGNAARAKRLTDDAAVGSSNRITTFGGRSVSIFNATTGALVWDSGNTLEAIAIAANVYDDTRSDDKGVEPEGVVVKVLNGRTYAIVSVERTTKSMLAVFDITNPAAVSFVTSTVLDGSLSPEGLLVIDAKDSPTKRDLLVVSNEVSNTLNFLDLGSLIAARPLAGAGTFTSTMLKDVEGGSTLKVSSLITNGEFTKGLNSSGLVYTPTGIFDGLGAYDNNDGTYTVLANSELGNTAGVPYLVNGVALTGARISKFIVQKDVDNNASNGFQSAVISGGIGYSSIVDAAGNPVTSASQLNGGFARFCSGSFEAANLFGQGRGFVNATYLTGEESSEGLFYALDTKGDTIYALPGLGRGGWETATQVDTGSNNTVGVLLMDDNTAPIYLWVGTKAAATDPDFLKRNGLAKEQGSLYTWVPSATASIGMDLGTAGVPDSADLANFGLGKTASGSWVLVGSGTEVAGWNQATLLANANAKGALQLSRLEDVNINPLNGKQVVFATTGNSAFGGTDTFGNLITLDLATAFNANGLIGSTNTTEATCSTCD